MSRLTIALNRQLTLPEDLLDHLGVKPGQQLDVRKLPEGGIELGSANLPQGLRLSAALASKPTK